jgi:uncharacterized membrane protein YphA (DoxX/SURF4 family)
MALLILRLVLGGLLVAHGAQKFFGSFGGHELKGTAGFFEQIGLKPGRAMASTLGCCFGATPFKHLAYLNRLARSGMPPFGVGLFTGGLKHLLRRIL